ncbi:MAG: NAD(P)H-hydrate dehydratase [Betaproteobacteria bacterium]|nr:NAD(P)H-hydrate dehydratase [Betaproteobacteria bacterium]
MNSEWILSTQGPKAFARFPVLDTIASRTFEKNAASNSPPGYLMQQAGLALAKLALAVAPHAHFFWIACGRGNNGGDGLEAAIHLHQWGKKIHVSMPPGDKPISADAGWALAKARQAGVLIHDHAPDHWDACIDALLGIGLSNAPTGTYADWIGRINSQSSDVISADIPSGLMADTGDAPGACVAATHTLSMLSLKPGQLTYQGRDACGNVWLTCLGVAAPMEPTAWLNPLPAVHQRPHLSHKGSFGDVAIAGGTLGMQGAAVLAARAALQSGAGRVYLALLPSAQGNISAHVPADIMQRHADVLQPQQLTLVAGCGGGEEIAHALPRLLMESKHLVLDADALNAIAASADLQKLLQGRAGDTTVITPHPLEAARLLGCSVGEVQADRLRAAQLMAKRFKCTVILKGSGSVIAAPDRAPYINPTGNGKLAIAGTGDVLAGMTGAALARHASAWKAACEACYRHGALADQWATSTSLTASRLLKSI